MNKLGVEADGTPLGSARSKKPLVGESLVLVLDPGGDTNGKV